MLHALLDKSENNYDYLKVFKHQTDKYLKLIHHIYIHMPIILTV